MSLGSNSVPGMTTPLNIPPNDTQEVDNDFPTGSPPTGSSLESVSNMCRTLPVLILDPNTLLGQNLQSAVLQLYGGNGAFGAESVRLKASSVANAHFNSEESSSSSRIGTMHPANNSLTAQNVASKRLSAELLAKTATIGQEKTSSISYFNQAVAVVNHLHDKRMGNILVQLMRKFPKPDLHVHMEGILPWGHMLELLRESSLFWHPSNDKLSTRPNSKTSWRAPIKASSIDLATQEKIKGKMLMPNTSRMESGDYRRFFTDVCEIRGKVIENADFSKVLERIVQVAERDNIRYMELMLELAREKVPAEFEGLLKEGMSHYYKSRELQEWIQKFVGKSGELLNKAEEHVRETFKEKFQCDKPISDPDSPICIRYNLELMRTKDNYIFFAWLAALLELADKDPRIGGVTIVGPQNDEKAMENFNEQLGFITFLRSQYRKPPKFTYHAGELNEVLAKAEFVDNELRTVLQHGNPNRIGHAFSLNSIELLRQLADKGVPVEVCLVSNANLLGSKADHPFKSMVTMGVSHILCSDNPGVHGTTLSEDYKTAVMEHDVGYEQLVQSNRNGVRHAFIEGEEIFESTRDRSIFKLKSCFEGMYDPDFKPNEEARRLLNRSPKARLQYNMERDIAKFEREVIPTYYSDLLVNSDRSSLSSST